MERKTRAWVRESARALTRVNSTLHFFIIFTVENCFHRIVTFSASISFFSLCLHQFWNCFNFTVFTLSIFFTQLRKSVVRKTKKKKDERIAEKPIPMCSEIQKDSLECSFGCYCARLFFFCSTAPFTYSAHVHSCNKSIVIRAICEIFIVSLFFFFFLFVANTQTLWSILLALRSI